MVKQYNKSEGLFSGRVRIKFILFRHFGLAYWGGGGKQLGLSAIGVCGGNQRHILTWLSLVTNEEYYTYTHTRIHISITPLYLFLLYFCLFSVYYFYEQPFKLMNIPSASSSSDFPTITTLWNGLGWERLAPNCLNCVLNRTLQKDSKF